MTSATKFVDIMPLDSYADTAESTHINPDGAVALIIYPSFVDLDDASAASLTLLAVGGDGNDHILWVSSAYASTGDKDPILFGKDVHSGVTGNVTGVPVPLTSEVKFQLSHDGTSTIDLHVTGELIY